MRFTRSDWIAYDTNEFIFALRESPTRPESYAIVFEHLSKFRLYIPYQVALELQHNLTPAEMRDVVRATQTCIEVHWDYFPAKPDRIAAYTAMGARFGDAAVAAQLEAAGVQWLVSENRHFLSELDGLPFRVLAAGELIDLL